MYTKHILKAFAPSTPIKYYINGTLIEHITTVESFVKNGLCNYDYTEDNSLEIIDNTIIIKA